jgi:hypothetical protein
MKKYILIITAIFLASFAYTQTNKEEVDLLQAAFGMDKKSIVADFVKPSEAQKAAFWQLYDEYETARKELGKQRITLLEDYAAHFIDMTPEQANEWTKKVIELQRKTDALIVSYYYKIRDKSDGIVATQFYQIENYILTAIRMQVLQNVPFLERKK